jgi:hypothetical protein
MAKASELTITIHEDTIQQSQMVPVLVAVTSKDTITDVIVWEHAHQVQPPASPWVRVTVISGNKDTDAVMTQPIQIPHSWFPIVIDVYEAATATEVADFHRTSEIDYDNTHKDRSFGGVKREPLTKKDERPDKLKGASK